MDPLTLAVLGIVGLVVVSRKAGPQSPAAVTTSPTPVSADSSTDPVVKDLGPRFVSSGGVSVYPGKPAPQGPSVTTEVLAAIATAKTAAGFASKVGIAVPAAAGAQVAALGAGIGIASIPAGLARLFGVPADFAPDLATAGVTALVGGVTAIGETVSDLITGGPGPSPEQLAIQAAVKANPDLTRQFALERAAQIRQSLAEGTSKFSRSSGQRDE